MHFWVKYLAGKHETDVCHVQNVNLTYFTWHLHMWYFCGFVSVRYVNIFIIILKMWFCFSGYNVFGAALYKLKVDFQLCAKIKIKLFLNKKLNANEPEKLLFCENAMSLLNECQKLLEKQKQNTI